MKFGVQKSFFSRIAILCVYKLKVGLFIHFGMLLCHFFTFQVELILIGVATLVKIHLQTKHICGIILIGVATCVEIVSANIVLCYKNLMYFNDFVFVFDFCSSIIE